MVAENVVYVPFRRDLYNKVISRSGGRIDPVRVAIEQLENWIERTVQDSHGWTEEGLEEWEIELELAESKPSVGDPSKGYQWKGLLLRNGSELRMAYQGKYHYAEVRHEKIIFQERAYSPSQLAGKIGGNTSRNAWRDLWIKFPGEMTWHLAADLRREKEREAASRVKELLKDLD